MESRINYTLIGLFVLLLGAAAIIIPLWLTSGLDQQQYRTYMIYMNEAVDGLSLNAPVKYNGVDVGYVRDIQLNYANPQQVKILLNIKDNVPVTSNTIAELRDRGITGVEYIGLKGGTQHNAYPLTAKKGERYPVITVAPSIRMKLDTGITKLMQNMNKLSNQLDNIFTPQNTQLFHQTLVNMQQISQTFATNSRQIQQSLQAMHDFTQTLSQSSQNLPELMTQLQSTTQNLQVLSNEVKNNPELLLRGKAPLPPGPGEEKP